MGNESHVPLGGMQGALGPHAEDTLPGPNHENQQRERLRNCSD